MDLCSACRNGDVRLVSKLLKRGANVNQARWSGFTALHRAGEFGQAQCAKKLLEHGADVNARTTWGWYTPLHLALANGHASVAHILAENGADRTLTDKKGQTPLQLCIARGHKEVAAEFKAVLMMIKDSNTQATVRQDSAS